MPISTNKAGADAASDQQVADAFRKIIAEDPEIQAVIRRVWGDTTVNQRPSDTPRHLEKANDAASKEIAAILRRKGIVLPERTFVNPRSGALEGHRGWSGLNGWQKAAIIAAGAATGVGAGMALAGGGAAAGAAGSGAAAGGGAGAGGVGAVTSGLAGMSLPGAVSIGAPSVAGAAGAGTAAAAGGGVLSTIGKFAKDNWRDIAGAAGTVIGAGAETAANNRGTQAQLQMMRDQNAITEEAAFQRAQAEQARLDMERRAADQEARETGYRQALRSQYLQGWAPASRPEGIETIRGGFNTVTDASRNTAAEMERQAMLKLLNGEQFDPLEAPRRVTLSDIPEPSTLERIGNWIGPLTTGLSILGRR